MTDLRKAAEMALEALENTTPTGFSIERDKQFYAAIAALRAAVEHDRRAALKHDRRVALNFVHQALQAEASISYVQPDEQTYGFEEPKP
jgi:hypothetical protein